MNSNVCVWSRSDEDRDESGEDVMKVCAVEKVEMKFSDRNAPYKRTRVSLPTTASNGGGQHANARQKDKGL